MKIAKANVYFHVKNRFLDFSAISYFSGGKLKVKQLAILQIEVFFPSNFMFSL